MTIDVVVAKGVEMSVGGGGAGNRESALMSGGGVLVRLAEVLVKEIFAGSPELSESFGKTLHTLSHSFSISTVRLSFWLAWKE